MRTILPSVILALAASAGAQDVPLFTEEFSPDEFRSRREKLYDAIGAGSDRKSVV